MHRAATLQVRKIKCLLSIPAVSGSDQVKERIVLGDRHRLPLTHGPARRRKAAAEHSDLTDKRFSHVLASFSFATGKCPEGQ